MKHGLITAIMGMAILLLGGPMACFVGAQGEVVEVKTEVEVQPEAVAWLGIYMGEVDGALRHVLELKEGQGVLISEVLKYSPADKAKLAKYDIILKVDKETIKGLDDLQEKLSDKKPDTQVTLTVLRKHKEITIPVVLGAKPPQGDGCGGRMCKFMKAKHEPVKRTWLGVHTMNLTDERVKKLDLKDNHGVVIEKVFDGSPAEEAKLKANDVILKLDGETVKNSGDLAEQIMARKAGEEVTLGILRDGKPIDITAILESKAFEEEGNWYQKTGRQMPKFFKFMKSGMKGCCPGGKCGQGKCKIKIMSQGDDMDEDELSFEEDFDIEDINDIKDIEDIEKMMKFLRDAAKRSSSKKELNHIGEMLMMLEFKYEWAKQKEEKD